jgi:hypothetical protein
LSAGLLLIAASLPEHFEISRDSGFCQCLALLHVDFLLCPGLIDVVIFHNCGGLLRITSSHSIRITSRFADCWTPRPLNFHFSSNISIADAAIVGFCFALRLLGSHLFQRVACVTVLDSVSTSSLSKSMFRSPGRQFSILVDMEWCVLIDIDSVIGLGFL